MKVDGLELLRMIRYGEIEEMTAIRDNAKNKVYILSIDKKGYTTLEDEYYHYMLDEYYLLDFLEGEFEIISKPLPNENVDEIEELPIYELEQPNDPVWYNRRKLNEIINTVNELKGVLK